MEQLQKQALLTWLSKTLHTEVTEVQSLRSGQLLVNLCNKIPDTKYEGWKDAYLRIKTLYEQLQNFMKNTIKYQFPNAISTMNLVQMVKGQDDQGLMSLLSLIFLVCFNLGPENSQIFVEKAIMLSERYQEELMDIVKNNQVPKYQTGQMEQFQQKYQKQRQKVKQMISALQNLSIQNDSLRESLISQAQDHKKLLQNLKKTEQEKDRMKKQLLQTFKTKEQDEPSKNIIAEHHQQMIQILKSNIVEQQQNYGQQIFQLKYKLQSLQQELDIYKNKANQLEQNSYKGTADHTNCVNIQNYKKQKAQMSNKLTEASSKQWKTKLENIRLQNLIQQLKEKNKKLSAESKNKENNISCSKNEANRLKLQFYTQIRDKLKKKIENNILLNTQSKKKQGKQNPQGIILDDAQID